MICQIRQSFLPPKFSCVQYYCCGEMIFDVVFDFVKIFEDVIIALLWELYVIALFYVVYLLY